MEQASTILRVLIIGPNRSEVLEAAKIAGERGADVRVVNNIADALQSLRRGSGADVVLADVDLGIPDVMASLHKERFALPVVAFGIDTQPNVAADAIKFGAREFLPLPPDPELIAAILESISVDERDLVFNDPAMVAVVSLAKKYAPAQANVLITGESGTGKEMMARFVHRQSSRSKGRFVSLNCAAIPENLLESELFGHEKGAFSGAVARRVGKFEEANGGTLFLDEISEMDVRLQAKLLRAIQEREIDRLGGSQPVKVDIRIVASSNRDLHEAVSSGSFREDLLFRLNVLAIELPSLRERPADIPVLANYFSEKLSRANQLAPKRLASETLSVLVSMPWKGNVRELENCIHRAILLSDTDTIHPDAIVNPHSGGFRHAGVSVGHKNTDRQDQNDDVVVSNRQNLSNEALSRDDRYGHLEQAKCSASVGYAQSGYGMPITNRAPTSGYANAGSYVPSPLDREDAAMEHSASRFGKTVAEVERELILETLGQTAGNRTHAANILGISIRTLRNKLKQYSDEGHCVSKAEFGYPT